MKDEVETESPVPRRRGRPALSRETPLALDAILDEADRIIRTEGIDALSMRRLATELGVTPRALYNHVPTKADLLDQLIERVWDTTTQGVEIDPTDIVETAVRLNLRLREAWNENGDLAVLATAVARNDERRRRGLDMTTALLRLAGFPDPPFAFYSLLTFTMGSIVLRATRRQSSAYLGRDPDETMAEALELYCDGTAPDNEDRRGITRALFDVGDDEHFERALRVLAKAMLDPDLDPDLDPGRDLGRD